MSVKKQLVGYLGRPGSYTHQAAEELFEGAKLVGFGTIFEIVDSAEKGEITAGVVPVENTIAGQPLTLDYMNAATSIARDHNLNTHLDGARGFNAAVAAIAIT